MLCIMCVAMRWHAMLLTAPVAALLPRCCSPLPLPLCPPGRLQRAYRDHQAEVRMRDLIAEEEEESKLEDERAAARAAVEKEKRAKKKERQRAKKVGESGTFGQAARAYTAVHSMAARKRVSCLCC